LPGVRGGRLKSPVAYPPSFHGYSLNADLKAFTATLNNTPGNYRAASLSQEHFREVNKAQPGRTKPSLCAFLGTPANKTSGTPLGRTALAAGVIRTDLHHATWQPGGTFYASTQQVGTELATAGERSLRLCQLVRHPSALADLVMSYLNLTCVGS
jgi:hypothetical protein